MNSICLFNDFYQLLFAGFIMCCSLALTAVVLLDLSSVVPGRTASLHVSALAQSRGEQQSGIDPPVPCIAPHSAPTIHNSVCQSGERLLWTLWWFAAVLWIIWVEDVYEFLNGYNEKWNPGIRSTEHEKLSTTTAWTVLWIWIRILDSYCFETSFKKDVNVPSKSNK